MAAFPRVIHKAHVTQDELVIVQMLQVTRSGWTSEEIVCLSLQHVVEKLTSTKENQALLIFDNRKSHIRPSVRYNGQIKWVTLFATPLHINFNHWIKFWPNEIIAVEPSMHG